MNRETQIHLMANGVLLTKLEIESLKVKFDGLSDDISENDAFYHCGLTERERTFLKFITSRKMGKEGTVRGDELLEPIVLKFIEMGTREINRRFNPPDFHRVDYRPREDNFVRNSDTLLNRY